MVLSCIIFSGKLGVELMVSLVMGGIAYGEKARLLGIAQRYAEWFLLLNGSVVEDSRPKKGERGPENRTITGQQITGCRLEVTKSDFQKSNHPSTSISDMRLRKNGVNDCIGNRMPMPKERLLFDETIDTWGGASFGIYSHEIIEWYTPSISFSF